MDTRTCFRCAATKPLSEFYRHPQTASGRLGKCKDCTKADVAAHRLKNITKVREYDRSRNVGDRRKRSASAARDWHKQHRETSVAHSALARALEAGEIKRLPCDFCRATPTVAHHDDYSKPLDVRWLCDPCHKSHHARLSGKTPWRLIALGVVK